MSRHTVQGTPGTILVVGYDRPTDEFFAQSWDEKENEVIDVHYDIDLDELEALIPEVPPGLREQLLKEAAGNTNTNTIKDWRNDP